jgi:hypothetical protein
VNADTNIVIREGRMNERSETNATSKFLPAAGQNVIVLCKHFRCLGFVDSGGKWWDSYSKEALPEAVGWRYLDGEELYPPHWLSLSNRDQAS